MFTIDAMLNPSATPAAQCPSCQTPMRAQELERNDHGTVHIETCFRCAGLWFDHFSSTQLAPVAVIQLFKQIQEHRNDERQALSAQLSCPRCRGNLALSFDLGKAGRFSYYRCAQGHGRFTPFVQFLREKQFVRTVNGAELAALRVQVKQIRCSDCGAPIDLEHDSQCSYCHAPVSFVDPDAIEKAVRLWASAEDRRQLSVATTEAFDRVRNTGLNDRIMLSAKSLQQADTTSSGLDLIAVGIQMLGALFTD